MISLKELNPKGLVLDAEQARNLFILHTRINIVRVKRGLPMVVTSGVRSIADHRRIYLEKAKRQGIVNPRIPMGSAHLKAAAVDIFDPDGSLMKWLKENPSVLEEAELYCEDGTKGWIHFQVYPPKSGKRWFMP